MIKVLTKRLYLFQLLKENPLLMSKLHVIDIFKLKSKETYSFTKTSIDAMISMLSLMLLRYFNIFFWEFVFFYEKERTVTGLFK